MTTGAENERLAVLENQYQSLQHDVSEIKTDVKSLVASQAVLSQALAVREASEIRERASRASTGVWVRSILPWVVAASALVLSAMNTFSRFTGP